MVSRGNMPSSFGRPQPPEQQQPAPVSHLGQMHAELVLTVSDEVLAQLGSRIASVVAHAVQQGFDSGMTTVLEGEPEAADEPPQHVPSDEQLGQLRGGR
jgi:hypothetical protein